MIIIIIRSRRRKTKEKEFEQILQYSVVHWVYVITITTEINNLQCAVVFYLPTTSRVFQRKKHKAFYHIGVGYSTPHL